MPHFISDGYAKRIANATGSENITEIMSEFLVDQHFQGQFDFTPQNIQVLLSTSENLDLFCGRFASLKKQDIINSGLYDATYEHVYNLFKVINASASIAEIAFIRNDFNQHIGRRQPRPIRIKSIPPTDSPTAGLPINQIIKKKNPESAASAAAKHNDNKTTLFSLGMDIKDKRRVTKEELMLHLLSNIPGSGKHIG